MRFVTPLSIDLDPEITKPTSRKIFVSADLVPDLSAVLYYGGVIDRVFCGPFILKSSCHDLKKLTKDEK